MTADFIAFHAAERPNAPALIRDGRTITYSEFDRDLRRFVRAICEIGLPRGRSVAVGCDDVYVHWLLLLALEHQGIATASFAGSTPADAPLFAAVDLVLAEPHFPIGTAKPHRRVTAEWVRDTLASADAGHEARPAGGPNDPLRILQTSGTTGVAKSLLVSRQMHEVRVSQNAFKYRLARDSRYLVTMPLNVGVVYSCVTACARLGGTVVSRAFGNLGAMAAALSTHAITHVTFLPIQLQQVLDHLPANFEKPPELTVFTLGAGVSPGLHQKTLARLAAGLCSGYGCNEVGIVSYTHDPHDGDYEYICPDAEVETIDPGNRRVPDGRMGEIRIRTTCMATGYLDDPEATARKFRDGWFYPGDIGILHGPRRLRIVGREDELLNIGGLKMAPSALETLVLQHVSPGDIGVCSVRNPQGIEEICVAVADSGHGDAELLRRVTGAFRDQHVGRFSVVKAARIPRNANGKIQRDLLKQVAAAAMGQKA
jgi:acyl-CoA synthetase (AMP-forming)/AMP-acid ligase II